MPPLADSAPFSLAAPDGGQSEKVATTLLAALLPGEFPSVQHIVLCAAALSLRDVARCALVLASTTWFSQAFVLMCHKKICEMLHWAGCCSPVIVFFTAAKYRM